VCLRFNTTEETVTAVFREEAVHGIVVDFSGREVLVQGQRLAPLLTRKEFDLLSVLWQRRGEACSRDVLAAHGWPEREQGDVGDTEIDQYIRRLRRRLGDNGKTHRIILTVRGYGYKIP
jgi:DNA-binding response OmpR family regulator